MKKTAMITMAMAAMAAAAELKTVRVEEDGEWKAETSEGVAIKAVSTNATGTVSVQSITHETYTWNEYETQTNEVRETRTNVVWEMVTNDVVTAWITNRVSSTKVESNFWARAVNETPTNHPYANMVYVTNKVAEAQVKTNIVEEVVVGTNIQLVATAKSRDLWKTNTVASLTLVDGMAQEALTGVTFAQGEKVIATGTGMKGGHVLILIRK